MFCREGAGFRCTTRRTLLRSEHIRVCSVFLPQCKNNSFHAKMLEGSLAELHNY